MATGIVPYGPNGRFEVQDEGRRVAVFDMLADAELFIAAPRLLEALEAAHDRFELLASTARNALTLGEPYIDEHGLTQQAKNCETAAKEIRAAMQAARGEE